jgi:hypothetical protein
MLLSSLYKVTSFLSENKEKSLNMIFFFRVLGHGTLLILFNLKTISEQRYPKGVCPRSMFSLIACFREALFKEWLQAYYAKR